MVVVEVLEYLRVVFALVNGFLKFYNETLSLLEALLNLREVQELLHYEAPPLVNPFLWVFEHMDHGILQVQAVLYHQIQNLRLVVLDSLVSNFFVNVLLLI